MERSNLLPPDLNMLVMPGLWGCKCWSIGYGEDEL